MDDITRNLPRVIADHVSAYNKPDPEVFLATFAPDALLNDAQREFLGRDAIRAWANKEIFGDKVTLDVQRAYRHHGQIVLHAKVDGTFDKSNLPDPLILTFYFSVEADKITQLLVSLNKVSWQPMHG